MLTLQSLENIELLLENEHSLTCRATNRVNKTSSLYKFLKKEYRSTHFSNELKHEYELCSSIKSEMTIEMLEHLTIDATPAIIMENFDGYPLLDDSSFDTYALEKFLTLAILITSALQGVHQKNVAICNLSPHQILYNTKTKQLKLTDFSLAQTLPLAKLESFTLPIPANLLPYISPEQTGRLNRDVDHRSDFYSLGVCLYLLFSGKLPFIAMEPTEYIHLHIARDPIPPHEANEAVPQLISKIILKLLDKTPENRYQSCKGIIHDLAVCLNSVNESGTVFDFSLGQKDVSETFKLSEKLYGREREISIILNEFDNIQESDSRMLFIAGPTGIGKSSLVNSLRKSVDQQRGYFLSGKFDQVPCDVPYMPIITAFQGFINQVLAEGESAVDSWKEKILSLVGNKGKIIIDVIPEVEFIIGKQPSLPELSPEENENRFSRTLSTFIHACSSRDKPVVLFLDDMQWTDLATLRFIENFLVRQKTKGILILGTYKNNQVPDSHPLHLTITRILQSGLELPTIELPPLNIENIENLIADSLFQNRKNISSLAAICLEKTGGNPFYVKQFLQACHLENHITYNSNLGGWQWDERAISIMEVTDNHLNHQIQSLETLDENTLKTLKFAACLGNSFDLTTLATVSQQSEEQTLDSLEKLGDIITGVQKSASISSLLDRTIQHTSPTYRFSHEQLQWVSYSLLSEQERKKTHLAVGMQLKSKESHIGGFSRVFDVTGHLNIGAELITSSKDKLHLARLNLLAGQKALSSAASLSAFNYLQAGLKILPPDSWTKNYDLTLALHAETAEAAYLSHNFSDAEKHFKIITNRCKNLLDLARAYSIQIRALKAQNMSPQAVSAGVEILRKFGVRLATNPGKLHILFSFLYTKLLLSKKRYKEILALPAVNDPHISAIMGLLHDIGTASYYANSAMLPLIAAKAIQLSLTNGNSPESSIMGYPTYGFLECGIPFGSIDKGYAFGLLSLDLQKQISANSPHPQTLYLVNNLIIHWKEHIKNTLPALSQAHTDCLETGDYEIAANSAYSYSYRLFLIGNNLEETSAKMAAYRDIIERLAHKIPLYRHRLFQQTVENFRINSANSTSLSGQFYSEKTLVPIHKEANDKTTLFLVYLVKLIQNFLFQKYDEAFKDARAAFQYIESATASAFVPVFYFYSALTLLANYKTSTILQKASIRKQIVFHLKKLRKWAKHCPENYLHKLFIVIAEKARIDSNHDKAMEYYDKAILEAKKNGYIQELALTHELAASCLFSKGRNQLARPHLQSAWYYFQKWGATAKTERMKKDYQREFDLIEEENKDAWFYSSQPADPLINSNPDVAAVIKATRTLTGKIFEEDFLKNLMEIMLENAGAQKGFLLFETNSEWQVKLHGSFEDDGLKIETLSHPKIHKKLSLNIVNYVARTKESVVLNNASGEGLFTQDQYVLRNKPKSILCTPVIHQGKISCIVYLENNLTVSAFPVKRQEILQLLGSHAAISIKNSNLYSELGKTVEKLHLEIKKRKETQLQLLQAEKLAALGRLSASIAHEFGNPLTGIRYLFQDISQRFLLSAEDTKLINIGIDECQRMKVLIRDMQQLNRPSSGEKKLFTPYKTLENILLFQKKNLKTNNIKVVKKYDSNITGVLAVEDQITQVLVNITLNAVDAMTNTGGTLTILTSQDSDYLSIIIKDTGVGIPLENQKHIVEPFFSTKPKVEGTGLGLPISYSIVQNHGGNITFTSTEGEGSTFHIRLPTNKQDTTYSSSPSTTV